MRNIKNGSNVKHSKIKSFIIGRPTFRFFKSFFYNKILPAFKYVSYLLIFIIFLVAIYLIFFKKLQLEDVKNYLTRYGYKAINFNHEGSYKRINIEGNKRTSYQEIADLVRKYLNNNKYVSNQLIIEDLKTQIEALPWVKEVVVSLSLQESLNIKITEHQPFSIWEDEGKKYIVSQEGKIIPVESTLEFENMIILLGDNAYKNAKSLFSILSIDNQINNHIYSATWVGGRRWNIRLDNDLLVKLPNNDDENIKEAWFNLIKIYNTPGALSGLKTIDLRIPKKTYLQYDEEHSKEIKSLTNAKSEFDKKYES